MKQILIFISFAFIATLTFSDDLPFGTGQRMKKTFYMIDSAFRSGDYPKAQADLEKSGYVYYADENNSKQEPVCGTVKLSNKQLVLVDVIKASNAHFYCHKSLVPSFPKKWDVQTTKVKWGGCYTITSSRYAEVTVSAVLKNNTSEIRQQKKDATRIQSVIFFDERHKMDNDYADNEVINYPFVKTLQIDSNEIYDELSAFIRDLGKISWKELIQNNLLKFSETLNEEEKTAINNLFDASIEIPYKIFITQKLNPLQRERVLRAGFYLVLTEISGSKWNSHYFVQNACSNQEYLDWKKGIVSDKSLRSGLHL